ncbi:cilium assembly protein DZIP1-like [Macrobrachium nipponense]|uniref:cilium assembly protein DZIP1-like n=1 Tax=Macrobrachium nipponense TaxID=159736 RepID=UPI0030C80E85
MMRTRLGSMSPAGGSVIPPTVEFPSQRRERVDWHKLASVDLHDLASGCSIEFLQENISHVTFCDAEAEFDLSTPSGQRSLLKMYRLAQLIIQYLFLSQEYIESQLQQSQDDVQQITEKYQQVKSKLLQQVEEAKKMKATNKNMRETVKYVNSVALANGIFQPSKCPICCKTFRDLEFLQSHVWRKHPNQASSVVLPQASTSAQVCAISVVNKDSKTVEVQSVAPDLSVPVQEPAKTNDVDAFRLLEIEKKFDAMNENFNRMLIDMENQKYMLEKENETRKEEIKKAWAEKHDIEKGYESQLRKLSEHIAQLQDAGREQIISVDNESLLNHIRNQDEEIKALKLQIEAQSTNASREEKGKEDIVDGISNELHDLKLQLQQQKKNHKRSLAEIQGNLRKEYEDALETEKLRLQAMMRDIARHESYGNEHLENSRKPVNHDSGKRRYQENSSKGVAQESLGKAANREPSGKVFRESAGKDVSQKPPPSPKVTLAKKPPVPDRSTKSPVKSPEMYEDSVHTFSYSRGSGSDSMYGRAPQLPSDSDSESETDTSQWNQSDLKIQHLRITSTDVDDEQRSESDRESENSTESEEEESSIHEESSDSLTLDTLLKENPQLWMQMRKATSEVLSSKLLQLGVQSSAKGLKTDILTSCLSHLRKERRKYEEKYENFSELRKRLGNEVNAKLDDKIENVENLSKVDTVEETVKSNKKKQSGVLSRVMHNVRSKVKESSKVLSTSVSKTGESMKSGVKEILHLDSGSNDVKVISRPGSAVSKVHSKTSLKDDSSSSDTEPDDSSSNAHVEIHNETSKSVSRNLFGDDPLPGGSSIQPKHGNFFENKTYGQIDDEDGMSGWDSGSDPEYENVKKSEPPIRTDSLQASTELVSYPSAVTNNWDLSVSEPKPIKLKKPSGEKVSTLSRTIEFQLSGRKKNKMAGAVDVMSGILTTSQNAGGLLEPPGSLQSTPTGSQQQIHSVSESSNTVPTSLWGSAEAVSKAHRSGLRPSTSKGNITSWDSEDDLEISEIE